jgi:redox-sensitive bicupin YhaK (pirin superfamily)
VLEGALEHKDSTGTGSVIGPGVVQRMSAGTGVVHSEWNASPIEPVHFLQIWLFPERRGIAPGYEQRTFAPAELAAGLRVVASPDGRQGSVTIHQDATLSVARLEAGAGVAHALAPERYAWVQVARGAVAVNGAALAAGDGAAVSTEAKLDIRAEGREGAEVLVFDLA